MADPTKGDAPEAHPTGDSEAISKRSNSFSQQSEASQTAAEFIRDQELLEADAREAMPYSINTCTNILGPLRQNVFACLTCNPPPSDSNPEWNPAGVCYACSVQCHGEHTLVEIFQKRNFTCDCGTTRIPSTSPCTIRPDPVTNTRGNVSGQEPDVNNKYNQNFRNRFCACECDYDPFQQKGTMFQCLGLGTHEDGGCGEDWYHPGCLVGMGPKWYEKMGSKKSKEKEEDGLGTIEEEGGNGPQDTKNDAENAVEREDDEVPMPPGFPDEDAFEGFICYKCAEANPWIKGYGNAEGFLPPVYLDQEEQPEVAAEESKKRKAEDDEDAEPTVKRVRSAEPSGPSQPGSSTSDRSMPNPSMPRPECKILLNRFFSSNPPDTNRPFSLFFRENFRSQFCDCPTCRSILISHPQLKEEEEVYEPPLSSAGSDANGGGSTHGSGSLLERGESALRNVDRVRAIEGVMAYNHLKEKLKPFFQQFAESGEAVGAEDIKAYFEKLRGDEEAIKQAGEKPGEGGGSGEGGGDRKEQSGY